MTTVEILEAPVRHWRCPACPTYTNTQRPDVHTEFHNCPGNGNLGIPLVQVESPDHAPEARHVPVIGEKGVLTAIRTERHDGSNDCTVFLGSN